MINLTIHARNGHLYELTSRYNQPQSSAAQRYTNDIYLTERTISFLSIEPETWLQILARINCRPTALYSYHAASVHKAVANAMMRGDLILYKLPLLNANNSLRGSKDIGLCIIKGPKLHCATHLSPVPIASKQTAQMLLAELGIGTNALLSYLNSHNLYNSYNQSNPLNEVLNRLASKELLAYQIQLPPMSVPEKKFELVAATGPGYDPVPLGPESSPKPTPATKPNKKAPPQSLEEAQQRLIDAGPAVRAAKAKKEPLPASSYSLEDKQAVIKSGVTERYAVRVVDSDHVKDDGYIAQKRDHGATIGWMAPLSMVEHGDTNAEALLKAFGTHYEPTKSYTILIIDTHQMNAVADVQTIIPTNQNLQKLITENPQITKVTPADSNQILSEEFAPKYYEFAKGMSSNKVDTSKEKNMVNFANMQGFSKDETKLLLKRHQLAKDISAWEEFTGNGMTMDTNAKNKTTYGPVELVMLDKSPQTLGKLKDQNTILILAAS